MYILFPNGVRTDGIVTKIVPGAYALVGKPSYAHCANAVENRFMVHNRCCVEVILAINGNGQGIS